jgi:hypothetical protein
LLLVKVFYTYIYLPLLQKAISGIRLSQNYLLILQYYVCTYTWLIKYYSSIIDNHLSLNTMNYIHTDTASPIIQMLEKFRHTRQMTEEICKPLAIEDYLPQPMVDVSPPKWHLAHTTWFFETFLLKRFIPDYTPFHPDFNYLFNSYYNNVGTRTARNHRGFLSRPTVNEIYDYRAYVNEQMYKLENYLSSGDERECKDLLEIGCQHEQQHQELLVTDLKYILSCNYIRPVYHSPLFPAANPAQVVQIAFLKVEEVFMISATGATTFILTMN